MALPLVMGGDSRLREETRKDELDRAREKIKRLRAELNLIAQSHVAEHCRRIARRALAGTR